MCEHRTTGKRKLHLTNHPADATLEQLAAAIKACWPCEQAHQQLKEELGLDHFEGRSWRGLHHHALLCRIAHAFLQSLRIGGEKAGRARPGQHPSTARTVATPDAARSAPPCRPCPDAPPRALPSTRTLHAMAYAAVNMAE